VSVKAGANVSVFVEELKVAWSSVWRAEVFINAQDMLTDGRV
jgi:hypothetical protein